MEDKQVINHIENLVSEEEKLYAKGNLTDADTKRLNKLKVELDQYWDLLRQRRAYREFGEDPEKAELRKAKVVENYKK